MRLLDTFAMFSSPRSWMSQKMISYEASSGRQKTLIQTPDRRKLTKINAAY